MSTNGSSRLTRRIVVVSPFLDKRHGTERAVVESLARLADEYEIHVYSQHVEDLNLEKIRWHRIPALPGPLLFSWIWWFAANHLWRWGDRWFAGLVPDITFSPGVNCFDADVVCVHIVFAEFRRQVHRELALRRNPLRFWPRLLHRRLYYGLIESLETSVYRRPSLLLASVSRKVAGELGRYYGRQEEITVLYHGIDAGQFSVSRRQDLRPDARRSLGLAEGDFVLLLVGNDWKKKGLPCLVAALAELLSANLRLLVVGTDNPAPFAAAIKRAGLAQRLSFLPPRPDVEFYYAAADAYVGPSLEDAFSLPPAEAMACGLPVITSRNSGVSEIITDGRDALILEDSNDSAALAAMIRQLAADPALCRRLGEAAVSTASGFTWERNAQQFRGLLEQAAAQKERRKLRQSEAS